MKRTRFINHHISLAGNNKNNILKSIAKLEESEKEWEAIKRKKYGI